MVDLGNRGLLHTPALLPHLPNLTQLTLSHNSLGFLPSHLSDLVHMRGLRLDHNFLTFLPDLSKMKRLRELRVDNNEQPELVDVCEERGIGLSSLFF